MHDVDTICHEIAALHRQRVFAMDQRKRAMNAIGAFLRLQLGWRLDLPAAERTAIAEQAATLIDTISAGETTGTGFDLIIEAALKAREPFVAIEDRSLKQMQALAVELPVWPVFGAEVRGFGEGSLAVIVGEAGNLANYANHSKLWKRMGLAVMGAGDGKADIRQGGLSKGAAKDDWIAHGYSAERRSRMFVIGDVLVKQQGPYREVYLTRKAYEVAKAEEAGLIVAPSAKIPAGKQALYRSQGHVHKRAQRYMEKRLLRDLHKAWAAAGEIEIARAA